MVSDHLGLLNNTVLSYSVCTMYMVKLTFFVQHSKGEQEKRNSVNMKIDYIP